MAEKTKKKFKLFDLNKDGKGVDPGEDRTPNLQFFFKQFGRKFTKIISLNILMIFQIIPLIAVAYIYLPLVMFPKHKHHSKGCSNNCVSHLYNSYKWLTVLLLLLCR